MTKLKKTTLGRAALLLTTLIWGSSFVVLKSALDSITPFWVLTIRFICATVLLFLMCIPIIRKLDREYIKGGVLMGLCLTAAYTVQTYGLIYTTPGKNAFLTATYCVLVPFLYWALFKNKPDKYNVIAAILCLVGMGFVCLDGSLSVNKGDYLTLACGLFYAFHIILTTKYVRGREPIMLAMLQFFVAGILCLVLALIFEPVPKAIPQNAWLGIGYLTVMCTAVCYFLQGFGQKYTPPSTAALIMTLESVFGTIISVAMGEENLTKNIVFGFCMIFVSVIISETKLDFLKKKD